ncbi:MAG: hypothetical protein HY819_25110, partial [Acidobacteria bacterium]|nr:hypothetical protein [Acidobacteriota bacterium]
KITNNKPKSAGTNLYQELDLAIDEYLEHQDISYINKAREIATDIDTRYGDKYGVDLVKYYQEFNTPTLKKAQTDSHKKLLEIFDRISADNYQQRLEEAQKLEKQFIALENFIEAQKTKIIISKLCVQLYKYDQADLFVQQGKKFATDKNYIFLETHFLLCQAKRLSQIPDFINAEKIFLEAIDLGNKLQLLKVVKSAGMSLATLYYRNDKNEDAFELAEKLLLVFPDYGNSQSIALLQIGGLSSFNLGKHELANSYLKQAIEHSITLKNPALVSRSYAFLSLILCEQKRFDQANNSFLLAESELNKVEDQTVRLELLSIIVGYKAKAMLLKNEYEKALELYQQKLSLLEQLKLENNLETSQVNEAMAIALTALGQKEKAQNYTAIAKYHKNLAEANNEKTNCLLSLLPTNCVSRK